MKSKMAVFWFVLSVALASVLAVQMTRARKQHLKLETLQVQVEELAEQGRTSEAQLQELKKERSDLRSEVLATEAELKKTRRVQNEAKQNVQGSARAGEGSQVKSGQNSGASGVGNFLGNMMKDPEMRKAMEQQQRMGLNM